MSQPNELNFEKYKVKKAEPAELAEQSGSAPLDFEKYKVQKTVNPFAADSNKAKIGLREIISGINEPIGTSLSKDITATGRGFTDVEEGLKQVLMEKGILPGDLDKYNRRVQAEREFYGTTPAGQDPFSQGVREFAQQSPMMALTGGPLGALRSIFTRLLASTAGGALGKSIEYVNPEESRAINTVKGAAEGLVTGAIPEIPSILGKLISPVEKTVKEAFFPVDKIRTQAEQAGLESEQAQEAYQKALEKAQSETGTSNLITAKRNAEKKLLQLQKLKENPSVNQEQYNLAKNEYEQANHDYINAQLKAASDVGTKDAFTIQTKLNKAKIELDNLKKSINEHPPTSQEETDRVMSEYNELQKNYEKAKSEAYSTVGANEQNSLNYKINTNREKLDEINTELANIQQMKKPDVSHTAKTLADANAAHEESSQLYNDADRSIESYLKPKAQNTVIPAKRVLEMQKKTHENLTNEINSIIKDFEKYDVKVRDEGQVKAKIADLLQEIKSSNANGELNFSGINKVANELNELLAQPESINAAEYIKVLRSAKKAARDAKEKAYGVNMDDAERDFWKQKLSNLDEKIEQMSGALENAVGTENNQRLMKFNEDWRNKIIPLYDNNIFQHVKKYGRFPNEDIMYSLRGEQNPGNQLIKEMIKNDPESLRAVIAQRYKDLDNPDDLLMEYLEKDPALIEQIGQRKSAKEAVEKSKQQLSIANESHKSATDELNKIKEKEETFQKKKQKIEKNVNLLEKFKNEIKEAESKYQAKKSEAKVTSEQSKRAKEINENIANIEQVIPKLEQHFKDINEYGYNQKVSKEKFEQLKQEIQSNEAKKQKLMMQEQQLKDDIAVLDEHIAKTKDLKTKANISLKEKTKLEKTYEESKKLREEARKRIFYTGLVLSGVTGSYQAKKYIANALGSTTGE